MRGVLVPMLLAAAMLAALAEPSAAQDRFSNEPLVTSEPRSGPGPAAPVSSGPSGTRVMLSLLAVAGLIVGVGWAYRRMFMNQQQKGGSGGVTLVSRSLLTPRHQVLVVRAGHRLLVVGDSGHGMNLLCEITDPGEVVAMLGEAAGEDGDLRADAFAATLGGAVDAFGGSMPGGDSEPIEDAPADLEEAQGQVRSLIERVRGLAGQMNGNEAGAEPAVNERV